MISLSVVLLSSDVIFVKIEKCRIKLLIKLFFFSIDVRLCCIVVVLYTHTSVFLSVFTVIFALNLFSFTLVVLNEEQAQFLRELVGPCSKFFEVSLIDLHFYFRIVLFYRLISLNI